MIWILVIVMFGSPAVGTAGSADNSAAYVLGEYDSAEVCQTAMYNFGYQAAQQRIVTVAAHCEAFSDPETEKQAVLP
ncbi:MAG: hypothetical protein KGJ13_11045 [Patescibacteria group bacterium]|nr:hypothetical protein [Patescibacteria group bacterium]